MEVAVVMILSVDKLAWKKRASSNSNNFITPPLKQKTVTRLVIV